MLPGISGESLLKQVAGNTVYLSYSKFLNIQSKPHNLPTISYKLPFMLTWLTILKQDGINNSWHISLNPHSPSKDLESQSPRSPAGRGAWKVCMPDPSHWVSPQRFGNSMLTPDSYSGQLGVILAIDSSDKDCLLSGLYILGAMSFRPPLSGCHLTLANIITINISSFKPRGLHPPCLQRCLVLLLGTSAQRCCGWWASPQQVAYLGFWRHCGFH